MPNETCSKHCQKFTAFTESAGQSAVVVGNSSNCLGGWIHLIPLEGPLRKFKLQRNSLQFEKPNDPVSPTHVLAQISE